MSASPVYAWCFDHGRAHTFPAGTKPWCTAAWVPFVAPTEKDALEAKKSAYGDACFLHQLPTDKQLEIIEIQESWAQHPDQLASPAE